MTPSKALIVWLRRNQALALLGLCGMALLSKYIAMKVIWKRNHFKKRSLDASMVKWVHAVNSVQKLNEALEGDATMLEADVSVNVKGEAIMAHPPAMTSDLSLVTFLQQTQKSGKGVKLDFKSAAAFKAAMKTVLQYSKSFEQQLWINGDVLPGRHLPPGGLPITRDEARTVLQFAQKRLPSAVFSLGWITMKHPDMMYDWSMVVDMYLFTQEVPLVSNVSFPVHSSYVRRSEHQLRWLVDVTKGSITVWDHVGDRPALDDMLYIRTKFPVHQVYYDLSSFDVEKFHSRKRAPKQLCDLNSLWNITYWTKDNNYLAGCKSLVLKDGVISVKSKQNLKRVQLEFTMQFFSLNKEDSDGGVSVFLRSTGKGDGVRIQMTAKGRININVKSLEESSDTDWHVVQASVETSDVYHVVVKDDGSLCEVYTFPDNSLSLVPTSPVVSKIVPYTSSAHNVSLTATASEYMALEDLKLFELK